MRISLKIIQKLYRIADWRGILQRHLNRQSKTEGTHAKIYQNPFYWAGFCAAGKGEQNMTDSIGQLEIFERADKFT
ncbi:MAG TPA: hypothetical protein VIQ31_15730 [Phormidium sp.]